MHENHNCRNKAFMHYENMIAAAIVMAGPLALPAGWSESFCLCDLFTSFLYVLLIEYARHRVLPANASEWEDVTRPTSRVRSGWIQVAGYLACSLQSI